MIVINEYHGKIFCLLFLSVCFLWSYSPAELDSSSGRKGGSASRSVSMERIKEMAVNDHIGLLKLAIAHYEENVDDYIGTFHKQERIGGKLGKKQLIDFKFKDKPYSLLMIWKKNPGPTDKLLYVEGQNDGYMIVHPTGLMSWKKSVRRDPEGKEALKASLKSCHWFGSYRTMKRMLEVYESAKSSGDLKAIFLKETTVDGRPCLLMERITPDKKNYLYRRLVWALDVEYLVPVYLTALDWDGNLYFEYSLENLIYNVGLSDKKFTAKANNL